jgi:hypothetical protein
VGINITQSDFTATWSCDIAGTTSASCSESFGGSAANSPGATQTVLSPSEITFFPVVITAGAEKLGAGASSTASSATVSSPGAAASITSAAILFPEVNPNQLAASIVSAGPSTTIYKIDCATGPNANESCGFGPGSDVGALEPWLTVGQNFIGMNFSAPGQSLTLSCDISSISSASCVEKITESVDGTTITTTVGGTTISTTVPGTVETTSLTTQLALSSGSITITGGLDKLASATSTSSGKASASSGGAAKETGLGLLALAAVAGVGMLV